MHSAHGRKCGPTCFLLIQKTCPAFYFLLHFLPPNLIFLRGKLHHFFRTNGTTFSPKNKYAFTHPPNHTFDFLADFLFWTGLISRISTTFLARFHLSFREWKEGREAGSSGSRKAGSRRLCSWSGGLVWYRSRGPMMAFKRVPSGHCDSPKKREKAAPQRIPSHRFVSPSNKWNVLFSLHKYRPHSLAPHLYHSLLLLPKSTDPTPQKKKRERTREKYKIK